MTRTSAPGPNQSPRPLAPPLAMSTATAEPEVTPSPIPIRNRRSSSSTAETTRPHPKHPEYPKPKLLLKIGDLNHPAAATFFKVHNACTLLPSCIEAVLQTLYPRKDQKIPQVRSITLILRPMGGVAYTTGLDIDDDHKEIHFSMDYINSRDLDDEGKKTEIEGVVVHELVQ